MFLQTICSDVFKIAPTAFVELFPHCILHTWLDLSYPLQLLGGAAQCMA